MELKVAYTTSGAYRSLAAEIGLTAASIYKEIRRCLGLKGGSVHQGAKWIYKSARELSELLGVSEKTVRRCLDRLLALGWLVRKQWDKRWGKRTYYYAFGPEAPFSGSVAAQEVQPAQDVQLNVDTVSSSKTRNPLSRNSLPGQTARNSQARSRSQQPRTRKGFGSIPDNPHWAPVGQVTPQAQLNGLLAAKATAEGGGAFEKDEDGFLVRS